MNSLQLARCCRLVDSCAELDDAGYCLGLYLKLHPLLDSDERGRVQTSILNIFDKNPTVDRFEQIAPLLNSEKVEAALPSIMALDNRLDRCKCLTSLIPTARPTAKSELIATALDAFKQSLLDRRERQEHTGYEYTHTIERLFPSLDEAQCREALALCIEIEPESFRVEALAALLPHLAEEERTCVIALLATTVADDGFASKGRVYGQITQLLSPFLRDDEERKIVVSAMRKARRMSRSDFLSILPSVCRVVQRDQGDSAVEQLYDSLIEVLSWYP